MELDKFEGADLKYDNNFFFQIAAQKYPNKAFLVWNSAIFILYENLQQDKFEDADLKHDNNIFKFQPKNMQIRQFWSQI